MRTIRQISQRLQRAKAIGVVDVDQLSRIYAALSSLHRNFEPSPWGTNAGAEADLSMLADVAIANPYASSRKTFTDFATEYFEALRRATNPFEAKASFRERYHANYRPR